MKNRFFSLFGTLLLMVPGCTSPLEQANPALEAALRCAAAKDLPERCKNTPAEFAAKQRSGKEIQAKLLLGVPPDQLRQEAIETLAKIQREVDRATHWNYRPETIRIPYLKKAPFVDGILSENEWQEAFRHTNAFQINSEEQLQDGSLWLVGWHGDTLYIAVHFIDQECCFRRLRSGAPEKERIYSGDALECFIRPRKNSKLYYEFLANPLGDLWSLTHVVLRSSPYLTLEEESSLAVTTRGSCDATGYFVEIAIPLRQLFSDWNIRPPQQGDSFSLMLVRSDLSANGEIRRYSPVPLLYDGHNIHGYLNAILD